MKMLNAILRVNMIVDCIVLQMAHCLIFNVRSVSRRLKCRPTTTFLCRGVGWAEDSALVSRMSVLMFLKSLSVIS